MKRGPSRTFVYLAIGMVFVLAVGVAMLMGAIQRQQPVHPIMQTATLLALGVPTTVYWLGQTATQQAQPPYEPTLYALRRTEEYAIMASLGPTHDYIFRLTETALVVTYQGTILPSPTPSATPPPLNSQPCVWTWARQDLPDATTAAQTTLNEAGLDNVTVRAEAYGENCLSGQSNTVSYFAAMTTDFYLTTAVSDLADTDELAETVIAAYEALLTLPAESLPARLGYLDILFTDGGEQRRFRAMFDEIGRALEQGLSGAEVLEVGG